MNPDNFHKTFVKIGTGKPVSVPVFNQFYKYFIDTLVAKNSFFLTKNYISINKWYAGNGRDAIIDATAHLFVNNCKRLKDIYRLFILDNSRFESRFFSIVQKTMVQRWHQMFNELYENERHRFTRREKNKPENDNFNEWLNKRKKEFFETQCVENGPDAVLFEITIKTMFWDAVKKTLNQNARSGLNENDIHVAHLVAREYLCDILTHSPDMLNKYVWRHTDAKPKTSQHLRFQWFFQKLKNEMRILYKQHF